VDTNTALGSGAENAGASGLRWTSPKLYPVTNVARVFRFSMVNSTLTEMCAAPSMPAARIRTTGSPVIVSTGVGLSSIGYC
jgi:hypothetical protein